MVEAGEKKTLILIDGNAILHRAYHALPPLTTRNGELVNAVYGFASMLLKILAELKPDFLIVAFDTGKPTFRQQEFIGYQAKRPKMDEELIGQTEKVRELVSAFGFPIVMKEGYEADDVIGTLAEKAVEEGLRVLVVTGDRDLMQLVGEGVGLYMPSRGLSEGEMIDEKKVKEKMGVLPGQIVDYKGLVGDSSDNYPGVPGIGPKTAAVLLNKFGSLEGIYQKLEEIRSSRELGGEKLAKKLEEGKESAFLSRKLAKILTDVPLEFDFKSSLVDGYDKEKVIDFFRKMGFRSLISRVQGKGNEVDGKKDEMQQKLF